jgi:hypothetical protein
VPDGARRVGDESPSPGLRRRAVGRVVAFREEFCDCLYTRADTLFELTYTVAPPAQQPASCVIFKLPVPPHGATMEATAVSGTRRAAVRPRQVSEDGTAMSGEVSELTELAYEGGRLPLTAAPVVGTPDRAYGEVFEPGTEPLGIGELRVTVLGSGDPFVRRSQAAASVLVEVGNQEQDFFFLDIGSGAVANFNGLGLPVTAATKVFLSHLHADHVGDLPTLLWCLAKGGRRDPVEVWGPAGEYELLGTRAFTEHLATAFAWDTESLAGDPRQGGVRTLTTEVPYEAQAVVYEHKGVTVTSFP